MSRRLPNVPIDSTARQQADVKTVTRTIDATVLSYYTAALIIDNSNHEPQYSIVGRKTAESCLRCQPVPKFHSARYVGTRTASRSSTPDKKAV